MQKKPHVEIFPSEDEIARYHRADTQVRATLVADAVDKKKILFVAAIVAFREKSIIKN